MINKSKNVIDKGSLADEGYVVEPHGNEPPVKSKLDSNHILRRINRKSGLVLPSHLENPISTTESNTNSNVDANTNNASSSAVNSTVSIHMFVYLCIYI